MNKVFASAVLAAAVLVPQAFADTITMNDGRVLDKVTVSKIGVREIEYTYDNRKKVVYAVSKFEVAQIKFKNGDVETFPIVESRKGGEFRRPRGEKGPGPRGERGEFRGRPGKFRGGEEAGELNGDEIAEQSPAAAPAKAEPAPAAQPVKAEPAKAEHKAEPAKAEPAKTEPAKAEHKAEPAKAEPAKTEPAKAQPAAAPAQPAPAAQPAAAPAKAEPAKAPAPAAQPAKAEPAKAQPAAAPAAQPAPAPAK